MFKEKFNSKKGVSQITCLQKKEILRGLNLFTEKKRNDDELH
jgi:hypothetical protein